LTTFGYAGLQVLYEDKWRSVKPEKNCFVVNLGDILARSTNFKLKATKHRVLDIGIQRYSSPFLCSPKFGTVIPSNLLVPEEE
jgi:isopenicillin N synthase-like dioxygenase